MPADQTWEAVAVLQVGGDKTEPMLLDAEKPVTVGRSARAGLRSPSANAHVPRELATLRRTRSGWILTNEGNTVGRSEVPVRVHGPYIAGRDGALFGAHAVVILQRGAWTIEWDLDVKITLVLIPAPEHQNYSVARDRPVEHEGIATLRPERLDLTPDQRRRMAGLFAYLIRGDAPPKNLIKTAAALLHEEESQIRTAFTNVKRKVNASPFRRHAEAIHSLEQLGDYLVNVSGVIGWEDLED